MRKILSTRKKVIIAGVAAVAVVGTGGAAYAFFTSSGQGSGDASVGSAGTLTVGDGVFDSTNPLYPGGSAENMTFTVTNNGAQPVHLAPSDVTPTLATVGNDIADANSQDVPGCLAQWFGLGGVSVSNNTLGAAGSPTDSATVTVPVTLGDSGTNQNACEGLRGPKVTIQIGQPSATPTGS